MSGMLPTSPRTRSLLAFADFVALAFHEARNVRHLIRGGLASANEYEALTQLASNRDKAWEQVQDLRRRARLSESAKSAERVFSDRFGLTLTELVALYELPDWKDSQTGGNAWSRITQAIIELREQVDEGEDMSWC
jgi:hypothetical protein